MHCCSVHFLCVAASWLKQSLHLSCWLLKSSLEVSLQSSPQRLPLVSLEQPGAAQCSPSPRCSSCLMDSTSLSRPPVAASSLQVVCPLPADVSFSALRSLLALVMYPEASAAPGAAGTGPRGGNRSWKRCDEAAVWTLQLVAGGARIG